MAVNSTFKPVVFESEQRPQTPVTLYLATKGIEEGADHFEAARALLKGYEQTLLPGFTEALETARDEGFASGSLKENTRYEQLLAHAEEHESEMQLLKAELKAVKEAIKQLKAGLKDKDSELTELETLLREKEELLLKSESLTPPLREEIASLKKQLSDERSATLSLQSELQESTSSKLSSESSLQKELSHLQNHLKTLDSKIYEKTGQIECLTAQIQRLCGEKQEALEAASLAQLALDKAESSIQEASDARDSDRDLLRTTQGDRDQAIAVRDAALSEASAARRERDRALQSRRQVVLVALAITAVAAGMFFASHSR